MSDKKEIELGGDLKQTTPLVVTTDIENAVKVHEHIGKYLSKVITVIKAEMVAEGIDDPTDERITEGTSKLIHDVACIKQFHGSLEKSIEELLAKYDVIK